jgi:pimeloyl-ACP methyl ester carboxylesterase
LAVVFAVTLMWVAVNDADGAQYSLQLSHGVVQAELTLSSRCASPSCPLVVLVPGFAVPMVVWDANVPALVHAGFSVLRFDLYGRGRSARPRVEYRPELFAEQVWELVTAPELKRQLPPKVKLPNRFHMVASSMGGVIAAVFAARHPDTLDRLVLVGPVGLAHDFPVLVTFLRAPGIGRWYFTGRFEAVMLDHLQENVNIDVCAYPTVLSEFRRQLQIPGTADAMFSTFRNTLLADVEDDYRQLGRRHLPTLAIWGTEDRLVPADPAAKQLGRMIPHLEVVKIRGAGHLPQLERPHTFNALVTRFLQR